MSQRTVKTYLAFLGSTVLFFLIAYYQPLGTLQHTRRKHEHNQTALNGIIVDSNIPPSEDGIGHFTLNKLDQLKLRLPREYINYNPNQPNGKVNGLSLSFFLPDMQSSIVMEKRLSGMTLKEMNKILHRLHIYVSISAKDHYIKCWEGRCLGSEFGLFQVAIDTFQSYENKKDSIKRLENGQYHKSLNLMGYLGKEKYSTVNKESEPDIIYLKPGADTSNPKEWIHCSGYACYQCWFYKGLYVDITFKRTQLPNYAIIQSKINQKIDEFIQNATVQ